MDLAFASEVLALKAFDGMCSVLSALRPLVEALRGPPLLLCGHFSINPKLSADAAMNQ